MKQSLSLFHLAIAITLIAMCATNTSRRALAQAPEPVIPSPVASPAPKVTEREPIPLQPSSLDAIQTISSRVGWQQMPLSLQQGSTYFITYVSGAWTVDYRLYPSVGPEGYGPQVDNRVGYYDFCKTVRSLPYATLLGRIGNGPIFAVRRGGAFTANGSGFLSLRINDNDSCQGDNAGAIQVEVGTGNPTTCYTLSRFVSPPNAGSLAATPSPNCGANGYTFGTLLTLSASPSNGFRFLGWSGDASGNSTIASVKVTGNLTVTASFKPNTLPEKPVVVLVRGFHGTPIINPPVYDVCQDQAYRVRPSDLPNNFPEYAKNDFGGFPKWLIEDGWDVWIAHIETGTRRTPSMAENALCLKRQIANIRAITGASQVVLIAHSMGGLVARAYIESSYLYRDSKDVSTLVTLGSPHVGTSLGTPLCLAYYSTQYAACEFSMFIDSFNDQHRKNGSVIYHFIAGDKTPLGVFGPLDYIVDGPNDGVVGKQSGLGRRYQWLGPPRDIFIPDSRHSFSASHSTLQWEFVVSCVQVPFRDELACVKLQVGLRQWFPSYFNTSPFDYSSHTETYECVRRLLSGRSCFNIEAAEFEGPVPAQAADRTSGQLPTFAGVLFPGQVITNSLLIDSAGFGQFHLSWLTGTLQFTLTNPAGVVIDPAYAAAHRDEVSYVEDSSQSSPQRSASYLITTTLPGVYVATIKAADLNSVGTNYTLWGWITSSRILTVTSDKPLYRAGDTAVITATLTNGGIGLSGATVKAYVKLPNGSTTILNLTDRGNGIYSGLYAIPFANGALGLIVTAYGSDGSIPYARQANNVLAVSPDTLVLAGQYSDNPQDDDGNGKYETLNVSISTQSFGLGTFLISGDLVDVNNSLVAHSVTSVTIGGGLAAPVLSFDGDDIRRSGVDGPYTLTNVTIVDLAYAGVPVIFRGKNLWTTAAYSAKDFAASCYVLDATSVAADTAITATPLPDCNSGLQYSSGTVVTLTAASAKGRPFGRWSGDIISTSNPITVTIQSDLRVQAEFDPFRVSLPILQR
ncbi:MAG: hypothetical protein RMN25_09885 [Anaerolineae bacterium]|nr:hypothetical protein [Thermoflexales bacterium]MDW8408078.1 hypothetical protein [Anaerolineae bacterium]